jgi:hypothetical protein
VQLYWAMNSVGGSYAVKDTFFAPFHLTANQVARVVRRHSDAYMVNRRCSLALLHWFLS